ncbi:MAG: VWA domain-containing protein [Bergeyella zoohelcum]|nr:VWA domain-containing protein [Bergeyella zoohelcum]
MNWNLDSYWYLLLLLIIPILGGIIIYFIKWRNKRKQDFADLQFQPIIFGEISIFFKFLPVIYLLAMFFLIISIVGIIGGKEEMKTNQKMNNVVFLLDVSNSMNAEDTPPSRLETAKNIITNALPQLKNDRIGMVVFAGEARSIMPLTTDVTAAEQYMAGIETSIVQTQGTDFLKAMEQVVIRLKNVPKSSRQVVLISDGEDNEGNEEEALKLAKKEGIKILSIGVGKEDGTPIPEYYYGQLMGYKTDFFGETILTKRQTRALEHLAEETGGVYINGNNIKSAVQSLSDELKKATGGTEVMIKSQNAVHYYQYTLIISLLLFFIIYLFNPKKDLSV